MSAAHVIIGGGGGGGGGGDRTPLSELNDSNPFSSGTAGKRKARHSSQSFFLGTLMGNFFFLIFVSMSLWLLGAGAWMAAGCGEYSCDDYPDNFESSLWLSWGLHFDPGTQTGINAMELYPQKWVATSFSIMGFLLNLVFLGLIVENIRVLLDSWRRTHGRIIENDHTVVLGWTDKTLFLLGELAEMMTDSQRGGGTIVVLGELDTLEMRMEVSIAFPEWSKKWKKVRVRYYNGKPYEVNDLLKVAVYAAERVIVLGCSRRPRVADSQMLTTICALRCLPGDKYLTKATNVIAELKQPQNEPVVCHIGGESESEMTQEQSEAADTSESGHPLSITPVVGNHAANAIMGLCGLDPSAGLALLDLMNFSGDQIETIPCSAFTAHGPTTFGVLRNSFSAATPLGIKTDGKDGEKGSIMLAPADDFLIEASYQLLVIAEDISSALASSKLAGEIIEKNYKKRTIRQPADLARAAGRLVRSASSFKLPASSAFKRSLNQVGVEPAADEVSTISTKGGSGSGGGGQGRRCLIFIGWQRGFESLLRLLDPRLPPNSELHILSEQTMLNRTLELNAEGLALDGAAMEKKEGDPDEDRQEVGLQNCRLIHYSGYTTDERAMRRLPLARADAAIVVADANEDDVEALGGARTQGSDGPHGLHPLPLYPPGLPSRMDCIPSPSPRWPPSEGAATSLSPAHLPGTSTSPSFCARSHAHSLLIPFRPFLPLPCTHPSPAPSPAPSLAGAELQIADSEALTSTILLRRIRAEVERDHPDAPPLTIVTEFVDLLTRRLLERQMSLITSAPKMPVKPKAVARGQSLKIATQDLVVDAPSPSPPEEGPASVHSGAPNPVRVSMEGRSKLPTRSEVQSVVFHRNYIETTALSLASHSDTSWTTVQMLLDPSSGQNIKSVPVHHAITLSPNGVTVPPPASPGLGGSKAPEEPNEGPGTYYSFADLSDIVTAQSLGLLIGWRRRKGEVIINPPEKTKNVRWYRGDELIVLKRS